MGQAGTTTTDTPAGAAPADRWAFIGSFTSAGGAGITTAAVDPATGALTARASHDTLPDPSWLAAGDRPGLLHAVSENDRGLIASFRADPRTGALTPVGAPVPTEAAGPTHLARFGDRLVSANYTDGSLSSVALDPAGAPRGPARVLPYRGTGPDPDRQERPHAHQVVVDPTGRLLLSADLGTDTVRVHDAEGPDGAPRVRSETRLRAGAGPRHLAFHPTAGLFYVAHELEPLVSVCRLDAGSGEVTVLAELPIPAAGAPGGARAYPSGIVVDPTGRHLWIAVRGTDTLVTWELAPDPAAPALVGSVPCGGAWPRDLAQDPLTGRLYVANERSGAVTWFDTDPDSGLPSAAGALAVRAPSRVLFGP
ncbi:lactonase family protein [Streptomyces sp. BI20]|uniref:lactonase family protein n=1 Tax=Streptomyces sp. BI20 TaxID=3403460 RepID=UPI003C72125C